MDEPEKKSLGLDNLRLYHFLIPVVLWIVMLFLMLILFKVTRGKDPREEIEGQWGWSDSTIFEFQKISLRFQNDSFFLMHRFMDPRNPTTRLPCSQPDYQLYASGKYFLSGDTLLRFDGNFTDYLFSRDTLQLCRDTGFRASTWMKLSGDTLCLKGEAFASNVCFTSVRGRE